MPPVSKNNIQKLHKKPFTKSATRIGKVVSGQLQKKLRKQRFVKPNRNINRGLVVIKHLPHGFFEEQIKDYFEQFGKVTRVRLMRSKHTGFSKGLAYVEFQIPEVAKIAAETMNNYLMFQKLIKAVYIPPEEQKFNYFKTSIRKILNKSGKYKWLSSRTASIQRKMTQYNNWNEENYNKRTTRQLGKIRKLCSKFADLGIDINQFVVHPSSSNNSVHVKELEVDGRNITNADVDGSKSPKPVTEYKFSKDVSLTDLLGDTILEDSDDEDYVCDESLNLIESPDESSEKKKKNVRKKCLSKELECLLNELPRASTSNMSSLRTKQNVVKKTIKSKSTANITRQLIKEKKKKL